MAFLNKEVFEREGNDRLSARSFYLSLGITLFFGLAMTAYFAESTAGSGTEISVMTLILCVIATFAGVIIAGMSSNPLVSFVGFNLVSVGFGVMFAPIVNMTSPDTIQNVCILTGGIAVVMTVLAMLFPQLFARLGGVLFGSLLGLVVVRFLQLFIPGLQSFTIIDWIAAGIFSLYIGYDWYRAMNIPKTLDNAVDVALSIYLDIINLALTIMRIMLAGKR